ncbi:hypothetical protein DP113_14345 [Brasilonema octagenarum UFV-E1]|uniref:Uncharacterized protein n=2 Tax=Brasilonema TaxID=383614 RepID=A0A856MCM5_9CYAN|nr:MULTISPECIES: hypothetical protein [Brasilonema]NMF66282.1 hypothetical protein [Brasilonema octagenarum UFV-OR1]QDL08933.1 hypothetical protein DP114_14415 [Brasilonema sennae CENA114]QDL15289.1 hypothetical protein DP113_14345 [Brasilonema octagenarum UFV-E1]
MKTQKIFKILVVSAILSGSLSFATDKPVQACNTGLSRLDPTCPGRPLGRPKEGGNQSQVGRDMTPPQVKIAGSLTQQGYRCYQLKEYPHNGCPVPAGMNSAAFPITGISYFALGGAKEWSWSCLNGGGQLWGRSDGRLLCQSNMR